MTDDERQTAKAAMSGGPLQGLRVLEMAAIGPVPFAGMILADMGAEVLRLDSPQRADDLGMVTQRGKRSLEVNLKRPAGRDLALSLVERTDVLLEGFRPGVMERLGLGPDVCLSRNQRLVYGRMTGWGQDGPLAMMAGHDINYIALSGVLSLIGRRGSPPTVPLNLLGDYGGGAMFLAFGTLCALFERARSGKGQVVDAAMVEGAAVLGAAFFSAYSAGRLSLERGTNALDSGAPWYDVYETADGRYVAVGAIEQRFFDALCDLLGIGPYPPAVRADRSSWPAIRAQLGAALRTRTRDEWGRIAQDTDACLTPVLDLREAPEHPQAQARGSFTTIDNVTHPAPAPKFSRSSTSVPRHLSGPTRRESDLAEWGIDAGILERLRAQGTVI